MYTFTKFVVKAGAPVILSNPWLMAVAAGLLVVGLVEERRNGKTQEC